MSVLITAGATCNPIDAVRFISAASSGRSGVTLARALQARDVAVWLMGSGEARLRAGDLPGEEYGSTRDLMARMERWVRAEPSGAVVHAAAVGDYEVAGTTAGKVPSGRERWELVLHPTPKIADRIRDWGCSGPYVTFKAAPPGTPEAELEAIARRQRERTRCDLVFANVLGQLGQGILLVGEATERFEHREAALRALAEWLAKQV
jgi:phosphopantothenoylcysteine decarboxylase/phosphopantothenate--cysteine ligase